MSQNITAKIGIIGMGKMARAMIDPWLDNGLITKDQLWVLSYKADSDAQWKRDYGASIAASVSDLLAAVDWVVLAIKPQQYTRIPSSALNASQTLISVMAGIRCERLASDWGTDGSILRIMPNTAIRIQSGTIGLTSHETANPSQIKAVNAALSALGTVVQLDESLFDAETAIGGSGPAFFYRIAQQWIAFAVAQGIPEADAQDLVASTMTGAGRMLAESGKRPEQLISEVASKGGSTMAGLSVFDEKDLGPQLQAILAAATQRAAELGKGLD